jgi:methionine biosynthesis protein MetW
MRADLAIIADWIKPGSSILDMGCGDGKLLKFLRDNRGVDGIGLEIDAQQIENCVRHNISVIQADLNDGLEQYFSDNSFDYVIMSQTLQAMDHPDKLIEEMLRVGRHGIITFPNMAYWKGRLQLGIRGVMPVTSNLPNHWFDTPNIHLCTVRDFESLCKQKNINILERTVVDHTHSRSTLLMRLLPNLFGEIAIYRFCRNGV